MGISFCIPHEPIEVVISDVSASVALHLSNIAQEGLLYLYDVALHGLLGELTARDAFTIVRFPRVIEIIYFLRLGFHFDTHNCPDE